MEIDITKCLKPNVVDSCALWNILSSLVFHSVIEDNKFDFCITAYVKYECLEKPRSFSTESERKLKLELEKHIAKGKFPAHELTLEDLQDESILALKNRLGRGEISSIAFAKKTGIAFLTDDMGARKKAKPILGNERVQTSPLILGWLHFHGMINDGDVENIIADHEGLHRPLSKYFREVVGESYRMRYFLSQVKSSNEPI